MTQGATGSLSLQLLGVPRWGNDSGGQGELSALDAAKLALLALEGPRARGALAGQLWPHASKDKAENNLRQHITRLHRTCQVKSVELGATVRLLPVVTVDALALQSVPAATLLGGELLAGCDYTGNDFLHDWVGERRALLRPLRADALAGHAEALERKGELAAAIQLAVRITELAPFHEVAWRRLMRLHYLRGDHTAAIDAFERFEATQRAQTGARPGPETLRLLDTIERGAQAKHPVSRRLPPSLLRPPLLVGRAQEWQAMHRAWQGGRSFLLLGEAGMGKSRLLGDFGGERAGSISERARPGDAQTPFSLLIRVLRALLSQPTCKPDPFTRHGLAHLLPELGREQSSQADETQLRSAVEQLLLTAQTAGIQALLLDDLQFADLATVETLRWLVASPALALFCFGFAARAEQDGPVAAVLRDWLLDSHRPERILVQPLLPQELEQLLSSLGLPEFAPAGLGARLHAHAGGHPLFTIETLKDAWLQQRDLQADTLPRPASVQALIEGRLRALPATAIDLVRVAAVAGADLDAERAAQLLGVTPLTLADAWRTLEQAGILQGARFSHDLLHECAATLVPAGLRLALHGVVAQLLTRDATVPAGHVASHWQAAERWSEAGQWWQRAAVAARRAGRLQEQQQLLETAAACHRRAGDAAAEFEAVRSGFQSLLIRHGGSAVMAALPRLDSLATGSASAQMECQILRAEALIDLERNAEALEAASAAAQQAQAHPQRLGDALCLKGLAMAKLGHAAEAATAAQQAADAAHAAGDPAQELRAVRSLAYSLYALGQMGQALPVQRRAVELAAVLGDEAESAAAEASLAAVLSAAGDALSAYTLATSAAGRYQAMRLARSSTVSTTNLIVHGNAAAYLGHFDQALRSLHDALAAAGDEAAAGVQAKARISLAQVQLWLGDCSAIPPLVGSLPAGTAPGMRMQAALLLALAEQMQGRSGREPLDRLGRLGAENAEAPVMLSAWVEWSYQGDTEAVLARLAKHREELQGLGLLGAARTVQLRELDRLCERHDRASTTLALQWAQTLCPHIAQGLNPKSYPPQAWAVLAQAFERSGQSEQAALCRQRAVAWIREVALPNLDPARHEAFLWRNPVNRVLLGGAP